MVKTLEQRIITYSCGCRYDSLTGLRMSLCKKHREPKKRGTEEALNKLNTAQELYEALKAITDEDRIVFFVNKVRQYPNEPVINLLEQEFPEVFLALAKAEGR